MNAFADMLAADALHVLSLDEFGESIWYYPVDSPGTGIQITAVVHRAASREEPNAYRTTQQTTLQVTCRNAATVGIHDPKTGDAVRLAGEPQGARWAYIETTHADPNLRTLVFHQVATVRAGEKPRSR
jgi:hypothetical protein